MPGPGKARIGDVLKQKGQLTSQQVSKIRVVQEKDGRPFGVLAQEMFGLTTQAVEAAWVEQYLNYDTRVDLSTERVDRTVLGLLDRRQAWQLQLLPLRRENEQLLVATTEQRLLRSVNYVWRRIRGPVLLLVAPTSQLEECLHAYYPWPAMQQRAVLQPVAAVSP